MTTAYLLDPLSFLIRTLCGFYITLLLLRFLLQWVRADFYNPVSQFVVRLTSPVLHPVRRIIPGWRGIDAAALLLAWLVQTLELALLALLYGVPVGAGLLALLWAIPALLELVLNLLLFALLIRVLLSWIQPDPYHPVIILLTRITDPFLLPVQRRVRPIAGIDLAPMVAMIVLIVLEMLLIPPLRFFTGSPF